MVRRLSTAWGPVAASLLLVGCTSADSTGPQDATPAVDEAMTSTSPPDAPAEVQISADEVRDVEEALGSGEEGPVLDVIGAGTGEFVDQEALSQLLALLEDVTLDHDTVTRVADGAVSVRAATADAEWLVYLVEGSDGEWRVALTEELP